MQFIQINRRPVMYEHKLMMLVRSIQFQTSNKKISLRSIKKLDNGISKERNGNFKWHGALIALTCQFYYIFKFPFLLLQITWSNINTNIILYNQSHYQSTSLSVSEFVCVCLFGCSLTPPKRRTPATWNFEGWRRF